MFWVKLLALAPDLVPVIVSAILSVESIYKGVKEGVLKKERVMDLIRAFLETKDYFVGASEATRSQIFALVDDAIDFIVSAFNYLGLFKREDKADFSPVETPND